MLLLATPAGASVTRIPHRCKAKHAAELCAIHWHHKRANQLRARLDKPPIRYQWIGERYPRRVPRLLTYWRRVHTRALSAWRHRPRTVWSSQWYSDALCVHHYEGAWNANTGNGYYGGLQMDSSFEATYGPEFVRAYGTADHWPPHDQLIAAYRAWRVRGWEPWPSTAAACGLL